MLKNVDDAVKERVGITRTGWLLEAIDNHLGHPDEDFSKLKEHYEFINGILNWNEHQKMAFRMSKQAIDHDC